MEDIIMYDVAIIGAGIVGCAVARELSKYDLNVVVIEKSFDVSDGSTKANSGIVHAGYDAVEGTLKAKLNVLGNRMYEDLCRELEVPFSRTGSLVIGFDEDEVKELRDLYNRGVNNGVEGLEVIDGTRLHEMEPNISEKAIAALYAPTAGITSPYELCIALAENANQNGVEFKLSTRVSKVYKYKDLFVIESNKDIVQAKYLVNAAGIFSDDINRMIGGTPFNIIPRRGEYCLIDKSQGAIVNSVIFQAPTKKGKGILVAPTTHGNLLIGPNAIEITDKENIDTTDVGLQEIINGAKRSVNNINFREIITSFSGVRATPDRRDFIINVPVKGAVNAAGIESPGLTSAPAIAEMVLDLLISEGLKTNKKPKFIKKRIRTKTFIEMDEAEKRASLKENPLFGKVICRCEHVTEGDIISAIRGPLGPKTVDGVKRRLRAGMGRCQGGFCMPRVVEILSKELNISPEEVLKAGEGSYILTGRTK
jgi:glycerol-3-phosphate dehydrogenase